MALTAAARLAVQGIEVEVIDPRTLKPLDVATIVRSVRKTNRLVIVNDGWHTCGFDLCWAAVRKEGTLAQVGIYPSRIETDFNRVVMKELTVIRSFGYVWSSWRRRIQLLSEGRVEAEALILHEVSLNQFEEAFRITQDGTAMKVIFTIGMT